MVKIGDCQSSFYTFPQVCLRYHLTSDVNRAKLIAQDMSKKKPRTKEEEVAVDQEFAELMSKFKPRFGVTVDITLSKKLARVGADVELLKRHGDNKLGKVYASKVFIGKKNAIPSLHYYLKKLK